MHTTNSYIRIRNMDPHRIEDIKSLNGHGLDILSKHTTKGGLPDWQTGSTYTVHTLQCVADLRHALDVIQTQWEITYTFGVSWERPMSSNRIGTLRSTKAEEEELLIIISITRMYTI